jgi:hypothetical protein
VQVGYAILLASAAQRECQSALSVTQSDTSLISMGDDVGRPLQQAIRAVCVAIENWRACRPINGRGLRLMAAEHGRARSGERQHRGDGHRAARFDMCIAASRDIYSTSTMCS